METLMEQRIEAKLDRIEQDIQCLNSKVDNLQYIDITNGGGRHLRYKRDEFFQMLYTRPKDAFVSVASFSEKALKILKFLGWISVIVYTAHNLVK